MDEIDIWRQTLEAGSTGTFNSDSDGYMYWRLQSTELGNYASVGTRFRFASYPSVLDDNNAVQKRLVAEWVARLNNVVNLNSTRTLMGFSRFNTAPTSAVTNLALFFQNGAGVDDLDARTDAGAGDEDTDISAVLPTLDTSDWNKYKIEAFKTGYRFYVNNFLVGTHTTAVPDKEFYLLFGCASGAGNTGSLDIQKDTLSIREEEVIV